VIVAGRTRDEGLAFFGGIVAGQSHEITNVLNIINELAGLERDLLEGAAAGRPVDIEKLLEITDKIEAQVRRGVIIVSHVSRFAHSTDLPVAVFDLGEVLEEVLFLAERIARLGRAELSSELPAKPISMEGSPFRVQQVVFTCIDIVLAALSGERRIALACRDDGDGAEISISTTDPIELTSEQEARIIALEGQLATSGGELVHSPRSGGPARFVIRLPLHGAGPRDGGETTTGGS